MRSARAPSSGRSGRRRAADIALNPDRAGHRYPTYRYEVSREKVREYLQATGGGPVPEDGPVLAPPTFAACFTVGRLGQVVDDPELGASWNLVHSSQSFDLHRPIAVGDVLRCTPVITEIRDRGRMGLLTLEIDCVDADDGAPVVTSRTGLVFFADAGGDGTDA